MTVEYGYLVGTFTIFDGATHEQVHVRTTTSPIKAEWSQDSQSLVTCHSFGINMVQQWDSLAQRPTRAFRGHTFGIDQMCWIDGDRVATSSMDHTVRVWSFKPQEYKTILREDHGAKQISFSPNGQWLATLSGDYDRVRLLSNRDGQVEREIRLGDQPIRDFAWSPDAKKLALWTFGKVTIWDLELQSAVHSFVVGHDSRNPADERSIDWDPTGKRLLTAAQGQLSVWDAKTGNRLCHIHRVPKIAAWSPDGERIVARAIWSRVTVMLDLTDIHNPKRTELDFSGPVAWSPDGKRLATGDNYGIVRVRDGKTGAELRRMEGHARSRLNDIVWHPDGSRIVSASELGIIKIWNAETGQELLTFREHGGPINAVRFSSDGMRLASAGDDGRVNVWDATFGYARSRSAKLLDVINRSKAEGLADADDYRRRAEIYASLGDSIKPRPTFNWRPRCWAMRHPRGSRRRSGSSGLIRPI